MATRRPWFTKIDTPSAEATCRFAHGFLKETFGFADLTDTSGMVTCIVAADVCRSSSYPLRVTRKAQPNPFDRQVAFSHVLASGLSE